MTTISTITILFCIIVILYCRKALAEAERTISWAHREFYSSPRASDRFPRPSMFRRLLLMVLFINSKYSTPMHMLFNSTAIICMANQTPEVIERLLFLSKDKLPEVIAKARSLQTTSPVDAEQNGKLENLIGVVSMMKAKHTHGDAMILS